MYVTMFLLFFHVIYIPFAFHECETLYDFAHCVRNTHSDFVRVRLQKTRRYEF
jgi:hypothetical protein